jgi:serine/threonine protein kinase
MTTDVEEPLPVLIDFGHAANLIAHDSCTCRLMTCTYSAPEVLSLKPHGHASDIWSLAATVYYLVARRELIRPAELSEMALRAAKLELSFDGTVWQTFPESFQLMLMDMTKCDPVGRLTMEKCIAHPFFPEFLGKEWINRENENVRLLSPGRLQDEVARIKQNFTENRGA